MLLIASRSAPAYLSQGLCGITLTVESAASRLSDCRPDPPSFCRQVRNSSPMQLQFVYLSDFPEVDCAFRCSLDVSFGEWYHAHAVVIVKTVALIITSCDVCWESEEWIESVDGALRHCFPFLFPFEVEIDELAKILYEYSGNWNGTGFPWIWIFSVMFIISGGENVLVG